MTRKELEQIIEGAVERAVDRAMSKYGNLNESVKSAPKVIPPQPKKESIDPELRKKLAKLILGEGFDELIPAKSSIPVNVNPLAKKLVEDPSMEKNPYKNLLVETAVNMDPSDISNLNNMSYGQ